MGNSKTSAANAGPGCAEPESSRGLAVADFWNDGRISATINNSGAKPMLLVNQAANTNHWIGIRVVGVQSNRDGIGANVRVFAGGRGWVQEVRSGSSYLSSNDLRLHFGIGAAAKIDRVDIDWPSGRKESFPSPPIDRVVSFTEGTGAAVARP
jgi:hypothetical protein